MQPESAYAKAKRLRGEMIRIVSGVDQHEASPDIRAGVRTLKRELGDMAVDVRDYELAGTRAEQQKLAQGVLKTLTHIEQHMLGLSQYNIFSAIEVAELSARIDLLTHEVV